MNRTKIEWSDYTINPVKGLCPMHCKTPNGYEYCYAAVERGLYKRFKWDPEIRLDVDSFLPLLTTIRIKPSRIFIGSTFELFGDWVKPEWLKFIFERVQMLPEHTFIFLTKRPENLIKWSPFPKNCWVGCSATNSEQAIRAMTELDFIEANVKFLSLEPLMNNDGYTKWEYIYYKKINWLIIGQQTPIKQATMPKIEWITSIVEAASKVGIPIFLKNNLESLIHREGQDNVYAKLLRTPSGKLRQEFPS